jgi:adenine-specific DNA-methyltransferase
MAGKYDHLSKDELARLLEARDRRDATRFGLVWEANEIERDKAINADFVALDLVPELSVGEGPWRNLIIEGDNFDALRYLRMTYAGRVKCIYIDPPYNTGNRDFVYNDRFVDVNDSWRHSTWVEFMYQRLTIAKELLTQDGVIFVSIDDNEVFALGLLMNRIFGERNFIANVIWQKAFSPKNTAKHFSADHDFILVYGRDGEVWRPNLLPRTKESEGRYKNPDNDPRGPWTSGDIQARNPYSLGTYPITCPSGRVISGPGRGMYWRVSFENFRKLDADGRIWWGKDGNGMPRLKRFLSEVMEGRVPQTLWTHEEVGHTQDAKKELLATIEFSDSASVFSTPKPIALVDRIVRLSSGPDDIIVDFFAGSGTTAHAVLKMNAEDSGNRRFILVSNAEATAQDPDKNLCRDVCAKRVRNVIKGNNDTPGTGGDFAYLRCRRIESGRLLEIEHAQVWTALQMIHGDTLTTYDSGDFQQKGDDDTALIYVPRFDKAFAPKLRQAVKRSAQVTLYSWQPETLRQHIRASHVQHEAIPESLVRRFGLRV